MRLCWQRRWALVTGGRASRACGKWSIDLIVLGVMGVAFYLPFYRGFTSQAGGIAPNLYNGTRFPQFFVMFGPFLTIGLMFGLALIYQAVRGKQARWLSFIGKAVAGGVGIVAAAGACWRACWAWASTLDFREGARHRARTLSPRWRRTA